MHWISLTVGWSSADEAALVGTLVKELALDKV